MLTSVVLDTHSVVWYLDDSPRLSQTAGDTIQDAIVGGMPVIVSAISLVEITYQVEKRRLTERQRTDLLDLLHDQNSGIHLAPLDLDIADAIQQISRDEVPDMPDRIIGATALHLGLPLVTSDSILQSSGITTIW